MDLRERLARLDKLTRRPGEGAAAAGGWVPGDCVQGDLEPGATEAAPPAELGLRELTTTAGPCWVREWREPAPALPGQLPDLTGLLTRHGERRPSSGRVLLLDTETTGLAGGTGTLAFLVGVAWWEGSELAIQQLFLPAPGRESGLLAKLAEWAAGFDVVVTYNGASFDLPLLRTRALMNRRGDPVAELAGWDLLPASRRLWGWALPDCRQQTIESAVCGLARGEGDIEGARIPEVWREWLAGAPADDLLCVLRHNRRDLAGMAEILARLCAAAAELAEPAPPVAADWQRAWALAMVAGRRRDHARAADWLEALLAADAAAQVREVKAGFGPVAVRILKRARRWQRLASFLDAELAAGAGAWAQREAAILYEHRLPCLERALQHAGQLAEPARVERLHRRLERAGRRDGGDEA